MRLLKYWLQLLMWAIGIALIVWLIWFCPETNAQRPPRVWYEMNISEQSKTTDRIITRRKNRSPFRTFTRRGDGMKYGIATKKATRSFGRIGQYKR